MKAVLVAPGLWCPHGAGSRPGAQALRSLAGPWGAPVPPPVQGSYRLRPQRSVKSGLTWAFVLMTLSSPESSLLQAFQLHRNKVRGLADTECSICRQQGGAAWGLEAVSHFQPRTQDLGPTASASRVQPGHWACCWAPCTQVLQAPSLVTAPLWSLGRPRRGWFSSFS